METIHNGERIIFTTVWVSNKLRVWINTQSNVVLDLEPYIPLDGAGSDSNWQSIGTVYKPKDKIVHIPATLVVEFDITDFLTLGVNEIWVEKYNKGYYPPKSGTPNLWFFDYRIVSRLGGVDTDLIGHQYESGQSQGPSLVGTDYYKIKYKVSATGTGSSYSVLLVDEQ